MATNQNDILAATQTQQADGALLTGQNGDDILFSQNTQTFTGTFQAQNNSGVSGTVTVTLTDTQMQVQVQAAGLEPNQIHPMHIHGLTSSADAPENSTVATTALDADGDGFVELSESGASQGAPLLDLRVGGQFPNADATGALNVTSTFDLSNLPQGTDANDLFPLDLRLIEIHGDTVPGGVGSNTDGEVDGTAGYKITLPVAAAELTDTTTAGTEGAVLRGDNGDDLLMGGGTDDLLLGGNGQDVLAGALGADELVGGPGRDVFIVGQGNDVVVDFQTSLDKLTFAQGTEPSAVQVTSTEEGVQLTAGSDTIILMGVQTDTTTLNIADWVA